MQLIFLERPCYSVFGRYSESVNSLVESIFIYAEAFLGRFKSELFPKRYELKRVALVVVLFFAGCPSAIVGRVPKIIVLSVKRVIVAWAWAHIFKKTFEPCFCAVTNKPAVANGNSAPTIPGIAAPFRVVTASFHVAPNPLFSFIGTAMNGIGDACRQWHRYFSDAATVCGFAVSKIVCIYKPRCSAFTAARSFSANRLADDYPFSKCFHCMTRFVGTKGLYHE